MTKVSNRRGSICTLLLLQDCKASPSDLLPFLFLATNPIVIVIITRKVWRPGIATSGSSYIPHAAVTASDILGTTYSYLDIHYAYRYVVEAMYLD